jgi:epoxyqueuosine reductase
MPDGNILPLSLLYNVDVMASSDMRNHIHSVLKTAGFGFRIVLAERLKILVETIKDQVSNGVFAEAVYEEYGKYFLDNPNKLPSSVRSIFITAAPQPQLRIGFQFPQGAKYFVLPPTYVYATDDAIKKLILEVVGPSGYKLFPIRTPLKLLAVRSGLARYGKNNIVYVNGMGSFNRLKAFLSDMPVDEDNWFDLEVLEKCNNCSACSKNCPTGAISGDSFAIKQEKCITFHNERMNEFPDWINKNWHTCLIGCMNCQSICPVNIEAKVRIEDGPIFNERESRNVLESKRSKLDTSTKRKIGASGLLDDFEILQRNLNLLVNNP